MKTLVLSALLAGLSAAPAGSQVKMGNSGAAVPGSAAADVHVAISASVSRDTLAAGSGAELLFRFTPKKGFHVNAVPPMAVRFDTAAPAKDGGRIVIPSDTATGYLKSAEAVRQPFALLPTAERGRAELTGILTYYYCSDAEGWCRKENLRFAVPVTVR